MIKIKLWNEGADEHWERELKKPNYILKTAWSLKNLDQIFLKKKDSKNPHHSIPARVDRFKILQVEDQPCCLNNEVIEAFLILGAKPQIGINKETIPIYLQDDPSVIDDLFKSIEEEIFYCLKEQDAVENFYQTLPIEVKQLKSFPKTIQKDPTYYYLITNIEAGLLTSINPKLDYWSDFSLYFKITINSKDYLVHFVHHSCQSDMARVYSYETKKPIYSEINEKIIIELLIFNIWKTCLEV